MKDNSTDQQLLLSKDQLRKASEICARLQVTKNTQLLKSDISTGFFKNPKDAILEEQVIQEAPPYFIALAAYISQAVEGIQDALLLLNQKIEQVGTVSSDVVSVVEKAVDSVGSLAKAAISETPVSDFRATLPQTALSKAQQSNPISDKLQRVPRQAILDALHRLVQGQKCLPKDVAMFEMSNYLPDYLKPLVDEELTHPSIS